MDLLLNRSKRFEWQISLLFFVINDKKLSSHMAKRIDNINSSNQKNHSYDKMGKMLVNLGNKNCQNNKNSTGHLSHIQKSLLISIVDTPEKDV